MPWSHIARILLLKCPGVRPGGIALVSVSNGQPDAEHLGETEKKTHASRPLHCFVDARFDLEYYQWVKNI